MAEVGYVPNALASAMRTKRSGVIGVVAGQLANPWYPLMLEALSKHLAPTGLSMNVWISQGENTDRAAINAIRSRTVDGLIFTTATRDSKALPAALESGLPLVLVNRVLDEITSDQVYSDNYGGGRSVARYFLDNGRTKVALIGGNQAISTGRDRRRGFIEEYKASGHAVEAAMSPEADFSFEAGVNAGRRILDLGRPQAVFCVTDVLAFGFIEAAKERGLRVPEDIWVVGYDDIPMASWGALSLTSVQQPMDLMAEGALRLLMSRINNPGSPLRSQILTTQLKVRNSTGAVPAI